MNEQEKNSDSIKEDDIEMDLDYDIDEEAQEEIRTPHEMIEILKLKLDEKEKAFVEMEDKWKRTYAEYENFRRRKLKEIQDIRKRSTERLVTKVVDVLDNFEIGIQTIEGNTDEKTLEGIKLIYNQLKGIMNDEGVEVIECLNQPFNPQKHEAVRTVECSECDEDLVVEVYRKGYFMYGKILRTPLVGVSRLPSEKNDKKTENEIEVNNKDNDN